MIFPLGLLDIEFLSIQIWDNLDILIVGYLFHLLFTILRGTIVFNIFIEILFIFIVSEETGSIGFAFQGKLTNQQLTDLLTPHFH